MMSEEVVFPCDLAEWTDVKPRLLQIASESHTLSARLLVNKLGDVHDLLPRISDSGSDDARGRRPRRDSSNRNVFSGLDTFLEEHCMDAEREIFFCRVLPFIIRKAVDIESLKPRDGLKFAKHEANELCVSRNLVSSILACSVLCLWPGRKGFSRTSPLCAINFDGFYNLCKSRPNQCAKLKCIVHYFETLSVLYRGPVGNIVFNRQVAQTELLLDDWLDCDESLCHMTVFTTGFIEDAGPNVLQVDFANRRLGGAVLTTGAVQEEIRFCTCPELIAGMLFQPVLHDNEALLIQGHENFSSYKGYGRTFRYDGPYHDLAQVDEKGNLENYLCVIDATPFKGSLTPDDQYRLDSVLRELNKAFVGFDQDCLKLTGTPAGGQSPEEEAVSAMTTVVEQYFATLSEDILTTALQDTLMCSYDESSSSSQLSSKLQIENKVIDPPEQDSANRRGSDISRRGSDISRRGSDSSRRSSDVSRRSSGSTSGSRRSSGTQHSTSTEYSSELDEYFATYQPRHVVKSSTIEEETVEQTKSVDAPAIPHNLPIMQHGHSSFCSSASNGKEQMVRPKVNARPHHADTGESQKQGMDGADPDRIHAADIIAEESKSTAAVSITGDGQYVKNIPELLTQQILAAAFSSDRCETLSLNSGGRHSHAKTESRGSKSKGAGSKSKGGGVKSKSDGSKSKKTSGFYPIVVQLEQESDSDSSVKEQSVSTGRKAKVKAWSTSGRNVARSRGVESEMPEKNAYGGAQLRHAEGRNACAGALGKGTSYLYAFVDTIVDDAFVSACREVQTYYVGESSQEDERGGVRCGEVEGFVGGMMQNVWTYSQYNVKKHIKEAQQAQQTWTSDSEIDLDLELYIYADDFVSSVLSEAVESYRAQKRDEQEKLEAMWRRAQDRFELDAMYFNAEFSRLWKDKKPKAESRFTRRVVEQDIMRRRSLDELGKYSHASKANGFKHAALYDNGFHLETGRKSPLLLVPGGRRASEPITRRRGSYDAQLLHPKHGERRRRSSQCSTSSREKILDWLNQTARLNSSGRSQRYRTTSSHLDWFAQDLLLEAFNDALKELYGDVIYGDNSDSANQSFSSSHSAEICDISLTIPDQALPIATHSKETLATESSSSSTSEIGKTARRNQVSKTDDVSKSDHSPQPSVKADSKQTPFLEFSGKNTEEAIASGWNSESSGRTSRETASGGNEPRGQVRSEVTAFAQRMIEGLYDNISNEVMEGAVCTLETVTSQQRRVTVATEERKASDMAVSGSDRDSVVKTDAPATSVHNVTKCLPIATGNWGCGVYNGDPQLKAFIQWMAASRHDTPNLYYYTVSHPMLEELGEVCRQLEERETRVGQLAQWVVDYCHQKRSGRHAKTLLEFIKHAQL